MADGNYVVKFCNKREIPVLVPNEGGPWFQLEPGQEITQVAWSPTTDYSRFSEIDYLPDDRVKVHYNKEWKQPEEWRHVIEFENLDGAPTEAVYLEPERRVYVYKGIPAIAPVSIGSPWIRWRKISWVREEEVRPNPANPHYAIRISIVKQKYEPRDATELQAIAEEIRQIAMKAGEKDVDSILRGLGLVK